MNSGDYGVCAAPIAEGQPSELVEDNQSDRAGERSDSQPKPFFHRWLEDWKRNNEEGKL
jgi:hypothetical protein